MRNALIALLILAATALAQPAPAASSVVGAGKRLHAIFDREWEYTMQQNPTWASSLGDRRWNNKWPDASLAAIEARQRHRVALLDELKKFPRAQLSAADQLNYDLFRKQTEEAIEEHGFHWYLAPLYQREGPQLADELGDQLRFTTVKDYEDWIARLRALPAHLEQVTELMREGVKEHIVHPKVIMQRIPAQIEKQIVADPEQSGFYRPFKRFPADLSAADRERLSAAAREAISNAVVPAYRKFHDFFVRDYLPACFDQVGAWQLPRGDAMYAFFVRRYTTTSLTPGQVHEIGLKEVARIRAEMEAIKDKTGFHGSMKEFFTYLRTDPRFFYKSPDDLLEAYKALAKTVDPNLVKVFRTLPRMPYGVKVIPAASAPDTTAAYYQEGAPDGSRAGAYYVNLYKPESRPKWEMTALTLHESVPGHHLQIALAQELGEIPKFRRFGYYVAFGEGWGLYAESLGEDMGLYSDPYDKFGELTYDMWRAVRLVVDTGMHAKHWTRQQAIDYFMENAPKAELDIVNEIDRYIAWPGQALGYKIGQLKFKELRERARQKLGAQFDVREYHEVALGSGAVPLDILERNVDAWIARKSKATAETQRRGEKSGK
ncbi:MAG TPA: DUF885 domain-containing protein [Terriglobales bacterium]|nr:DUF885 domain-containing protein [Terriglobales bacterium]